MTADTMTDSNFAPNWRHISAFLGLTFGLTWLLDLAIYLSGGLATPGMTTILQLQMLLPAFSAIVLGLFFFPESPIYHRRPAGRGRWFYYYFLLLTGLYAVSAVAVWLAPAAGTITLVAAVTQIVAFLGLLVLVVLRFVAGREGMARVGLAGGPWRTWLLFGAGFVVYYVLQAALNAYLGLGGAHLAPPPGAPDLTPGLLLVVGGLQSVVLAPILAIVIAFGEEYGWRGYLQSELIKLGRVRGVLLLGVIWGIWHWPVILMGYNYPGYPLLGLVFMTLYTMGLAVVLGYAVLKSGSVLLAAYLHALNNQVMNFIAAMGFQPFSPILSFGIGIYGIGTLAIVALLILRDPTWRGKEGDLAWSRGHLQA